MPPALAHVRSWIFDLDNTLYPASARLFELVDERMGAYLQRLLSCDAVEARRIQKRYFAEHGTTLAGLMKFHGTDPHEFLGFVHDIAVDRVAPNPALVSAIGRLPGRKFVFTNADGPYADRVLRRLGFKSEFDAVHDIHAMGQMPKPAPAAYQGLCNALCIDPAAALFADDMARNLQPAKSIGMATLWINNGSDQAGAEACADWVDYETGDLTGWLADIE